MTARKVSPERQRVVVQSIKQLKFLDESIDLIPEYTETLFLIFELPDAADGGVESWLAHFSEVRVKIFEMPTEMNEAGLVTRRVKFEFPVQVATFDEYYESGKLVATEVMKK